jgi:peptidoglycan/LPS O-acetylase OafA/YrhL
MLPQKAKLFFPNLDGLRFIAFLAVFITHTMGCLDYGNKNKAYHFIRDRFLMNGDLGVNLFFVLSGFLITFLLLKEKELNGKINVPHFYVRRILRIWPVYFFVVGICLLIMPLFENYIPEHFPISVSVEQLNPWYYLTFTGNFDYLNNGISNVLIGVLWSVSVEEQFYLFWPLLILFIPKKYLLPTFIFLIAGSISFRLFCSNGGNAMILKYHSLSSVSDLATGAVLALLCTKKSFTDKAKKIPRWLIIFAYLLLFTLIPFKGLIWKFGLYYKHVAAILPVIFSAIFAFFILEQNYAERSFYKIGNFKKISFLGRYTYGMYCYHIIIMFLVIYTFYLSGIDVLHPTKYEFLAESITALVLTILFSKFSYRYIEGNFLRLKERFSNIRKGQFYS